MVCMVLSGPSGVGVNELRKKLIEINPRTFLGPTPRQYALALTPLIIKNMRSVWILHHMCIFCVYRHDKTTEDVRGAWERVSLPQQRSVWEHGAQQQVVSHTLWVFIDEYKGLLTLNTIWRIYTQLLQGRVCFLRFVEYGEFRAHLYGTSVDAVKDVLGAGKICIIDIDPNVSLKLLSYSQIHIWYWFVIK